MRSMKGVQLFVDGEWFNVDAADYAPNSLLLLNAKSAEFATSGRWSASIHRVLSELQSRVTLLFFTQTRDDAVIGPIEGCAVCEDRAVPF